MKFDDKSLLAIFVGVRKKMKLINWQSIFNDAETKAVQQIINELKEKSDETQ